MRHLNILFASLFTGFVIAACSETNSTTDDPPFAPQTYNVQGKVEKGPFISGSEITIQPMNSKLQVLGTMFNTSITDEIGNFILGSKEFETPYAEFMANGYFFNEIKGELSNGTITLRALVDLENNTTTNVNILTHLKYERIKKLVKSGKTFDEANTQAQKELFTAFGLSAYSGKEASSFSIAAGTDEAAALIAISSLLLMERSEAAFTEYLAKLSADFGKNGTFSEENKKQIEADKKELAEKLDNIKENIIKRYQSLGIDVEVKELAHFVDWNNDGKAGNELLKGYENIKIETPVIEVPNEGGTYNIKIESPIQLFLNSKEEPDTNIVVSPGNTTSMLFTSLYEGYEKEDKEISCESSLDGNILNIKISALQSNNDKSKSINLYDYIGNVAGTITINQKGKLPDNIVSKTPLLGKDGQALVASIAMQMTEALKEYNIIEQYYNSNPTTNYVRRFVSPSSSQILSLWSKFYKANRSLLALKNADEKQLNVYGDYCNILSAIYYSNLVYGWGGVPYLADYSQIETPQINGYPRVPAENIFEDLKNKLSNAIENLPEKKNESLKDINEFFFASKDVARVLLANIYMYESNYKEAQPLLEKVIENGFYSFDANADYNLSQNDAAASKEVIFALINNSEQKTDGTITEAAIIPYITLSDVYLSLAECHYQMDNFGIAEQNLQSVTDTKNLTVTKKNTLLKIKDAREELLLHSGTYFAFLKRTGIAIDVCSIEEYQLLFPIPESELIVTPNMTQNPGY